MQIVASRYGAGEIWLPSCMDAGSPGFALHRYADSSRPVDFPVALGGRLFGSLSMLLGTGGLI